MAQAMTVQNTRDRIEQGLLAQFGKAFERATEAAKTISDPARRALGAARIALEHAVLQTALEKDMPTRSVTSMLEQASPQQVAHFIKSGRQSIERVYGVQPEQMAAALSAQVANLDLPRGLAQTEAMRELVDQGRNLVNKAVGEMYASRGTFAFDSPRSDYLQLQTPAGAITPKEQLTNHMTFIESAVNYAVSAGKLDQQQGQALKDRIEHQIFNVPPDSKLSPNFQQFYERKGAGLRQEVMADARKVTNSRTVAEIAQRLHEARDRVDKLRTAQVERG